MLDLDNFKRINDKYGHLKGDEVLKKVADILKKHFRSYDVVARFGGDEFLVLILSSESKNRIKKRLIDIRREIEKIFPEENLSVSFGIVTFPSDFKGLKNKDEIVRVLISTVDSLMYRDKKKRKGML
jgi:diguanylate cyclase (GGDEF)-like protein